MKFRNINFTHTIKHNAKDKRKQIKGEKRRVTSRKQSHRLLLYANAYLEQRKR